MATISFRAKAETIYNCDETVAYQRLKVPAIKRSHCDMDAFRKHRAFGSYANSELFPAMLRRALQASNVPAYIRLDQPLPDCVTVDASGFLHLVTIEL